MRGVLVLFAVFGVAHAMTLQQSYANITVEDVPQFVDLEECLCELPRQPPPPHDIQITQDQVTVGWGRVSQTFFCLPTTNLWMSTAQGPFRLIFRGLSRPFVVSALPADTDVAFKIQEQNCAGQSPFSDELTIHTPSLLVRPEAPNLVSSDESSICVQWKTLVPSAVMLNLRIPTQGEDALSPAWETIFEGEGTSACAHNLTSSTTYQFRLFVHDTPLHIPVGDSLIAKTGISPPFPPLQPFVSEATESSLTVRWSRTISESNRSPIKSYIVELLGANTNPNKTVNASAVFHKTQVVHKMIATFEDLLPGTEYSIRVRAENEAGESDPSPVLLARTDATVPTVCERIVFSEVSANAVRLGWSKAQGRGDVVLKYELQISEGGALPDFKPVYTGPSNATHVEKLLSEVYYGFRVRAINSVGAGEWSEQYNVKTPVTGALTNEQLKDASVPMQALAK